MPRGAGAACLSVRDLTVEFATDDGWVPVIQDLSFDVGQRETLAIVGESGAGKSVTGLACMGLLPSGVSRVRRGQAILDGEDDLLSVSRRRLEDLRGRRIAMAFQEPMTSLNPSHRVGRQIAEVVQRHRGASRADAARRAVEVMEMVGIPHPAARAASFPHEFSGGMRQRIMIAMAIACEPRLLIADELTTALDVTVQAQVLGVLKDLRDQLGTSLVVITHDLGVVADIADRVMVMYAGRAVEVAEVHDLFAAPRHPYTEGLLRAIPTLNRGEQLPSIPGQPPAPSRDRGGCAFRARCPYRIETCAASEPELESQAGRAMRCLRHAELKLRGVRG